jgi:hypothetical protein
MDFFLDSEDDHSVNDKSNNKNNKNDKDFQCENCGGDDSYMDSNTGGLCCTQCFTQSQTTVAASQVDMEMDETLGLMARNRKGAAISRHQKKNGPGRRKRRPLSDYDRTKMLPQVQECIRGIQRVLKECSPIISELAGADDKEAVFQTCKTIWNAYLQSWYDGAQYYGAIYPEIRFCFRDNFLEGTMLYKVLRTLSYKAVDHVKQVLAEEKEESKDNIETKTTSTTKPTPPKKKQEKRDIEQILADASDSDNYDGMDDDDDDANNNRSSTKSKPKLSNLLQDDGDDNAVQDLDFDDDDDTERDSPISKSWKTENGNVSSNRIKLMLHLHNQSRPCGRREAALALKPSMTVVAAILWMAVSPLGVTGGHICDWVSNGSLPLINAFNLLSPTERTTLRAIDSFFTLRDRTSVKYLTNAVASLQIICDYQPPPIIRRSANTAKNKRQAANTAKNKRQKKGAVTRMVNQQTGVVVRSTKRAAYSDVQRGMLKAFVPGQLLTPTSVPLLAARFVADMKLSQTVLNLTLALMGVPTAKKTHKKVRGMPQFWVPPQLKLARPEKLQYPAQVLGVIVIACKLTPDWYSQNYQRPLSSNVNWCTTSTTNKNDHTRKSASIKTEDDIDLALIVNKEEGKRHARLKNIMQARSRFVPWSEGQFRCLGNGPIMEGYLDFLEQQLISESSEAVLPDFMAALDAVEVKQLPTQDPPQQDPPQQPQVRPCPTLWAPFRPFRPQTVPKINACEVFKASNSETAPPPSLNFGMLIEYMAYRTCLEPSKIELFALALDDEIQERFCIQDNVEMHPIALYRWIGDPRSTQVHETASFQATAMSELMRENARASMSLNKTELPASLPVELEIDDEGDQMASETTAPSKRNSQSINAGGKKVRKSPAMSAAERKSSPDETAEDAKQTLVQTISPAMDKPQSDTVGAQPQLHSEIYTESSMLELQSQSLSEKVVQAFSERGEVEWI